MRRARVFFRLCFTTFTLTIIMHHLWLLGNKYAREWEPNLPRRSKKYARGAIQPHLIPQGFCVQESLLVIVVCSAPRNFENRNAIRQTWGQKTAETQLVFLLGEVKGNHTLQDLIEKEYLQFDDIVQESFVDSYNNLTLKSIHMLQLYNRYCSSSHKYLMKADDDVLIHMPKMVAILMKQDRSQDLLLGQVFTKVFPHRNSSSKWYAPYDLYPHKTYPDYLNGPVYLMSGSVAKKLYGCTLQTPKLYIEDVYITGICASKMNLKLTNNKQFGYALKDSICNYRNMITFYEITPQFLLDNYIKFVTNKCS